MKALVMAIFTYHSADDMFFQINMVKDVNIRKIKTGTNFIFSLVFIY